MTKSPFLVPVACLSLAVSVAPAQEMAIRSGEVTAIVPIEAEGQPAPRSSSNSATSSALGRALGRVAGRTAARVAGDYSYDAYDVASSATRDATDNAAQAAATPAPGTAYMVMIRFEDGSESAIQTDDASGLAVGGRVKVLGSGSSARLVPGG
ncbi:hypothetical protein H4F99_01245 [Lysobacter sp. SG-8]|uniref:Uncharacterized protein n=1 Tax=Marilutibacter penaei TaxID=2759900 RepID=A0A7W3YD90_9GAMM|nr:hypothetical protein [Lysobacter penaei]MBB1087108.1 hypothetical protein [Lysobacter penaei]